MALGKSNISDSIRWVLGEQSIKSLRGSKSEDIIFSGTQSRKSLGFAEASIVIDNQDGRLPIEYGEVTVTRRIYRSGESGYFINKAPCRLKDVLELFMDTGIGRDGYSIIGQGKIDEILSNKSEDRRHIFEEAAGIVKYRTRKAESEKKLEQTKLNLLRINDILSEIEGNIEPLKLQSEKAKKFLNLREELKSIEIGLFIYNIDSFKAKIKEALEEEDIFRTQIVKEEEKLNNIQLEKESLKEEIDKLIEEIERVQNLSFEGEKRKEQLNSEKNVATERCVNNKENFERYSIEIENAKNKIKELEDEKKGKSAKKDNLIANKEKFVKELNEKEKELEKIVSELNGKELEIEDKKQKLQDNIDRKYEAIALINSEKANLENLDKREKTLKNEISSNISELDENRMNREEITKSFYEIESKRNEIKKNLDELETKKQETQAKLKDYDTKINMFSSEYRIKESRLKFLIETEKEKEGYNRSIKSLLLANENKSEFTKGMHGVLANLISVPKEFEIAVEMALGQAMQNIVTDKEDDAKKMIEFLRNEKLGRASFLPLTSVKGKKLDKISKSNLNGVYGVASDLIKYDKKYDGVIQNLLGRTVIVENMEVAIALAKQNSYSFKIVTKDGDIVNPSGSMTGGSVAQKTVNILGRANEIKELEKELKNLKEKIDKLSKEKDEFEKSSQDTLEIVAGFERELQDSEITYATEKQKVVSFDEQIKRLENKLEQNRKELENQSTLRKDMIENTNKLKLEIENIEKENEEYNKEIDEFAILNKDKQSYIDDLKSDITNLKISVSSFDESELSIKEILERIENEISNYRKSIENKETLKIQLEEENKSIEEQIQNILLKMEELEKEVENSGNKSVELKQERASKSEKLDLIEENITEQQEKLENLKNQVNKIEVKKSKLEVELEQIVNKMWEEYELTPNAAVESYKVPENVAEVQKRVASIRNEIKDLGSINIDSIKEYKELKERYDFMCEQRLDLENASNKLKNVIADITDTMKTQFKEQFKIINKNFGEVFAELFGGGRAELKLVDEENILECGIDIEAEPPGKKLQNMMLLSGGEKAFTAIALLFAILKINPAPFCVLDEIEAALDDVNVYRFAEYLKKFTKDTQFLVITHRKGTMEAADTVYGITMEESGISKLLSMKLK